MPLIRETCQRSLICFSLNVHPNHSRSRNPDVDAICPRTFLALLSGSIFHFLLHLESFPLIYFNVNRYSRTCIFSTVWLCEFNSIFAVCWNLRELQNCREFMVFKTFSWEESLFSWSLNKKSTMRFSDCVQGLQLKFVQSTIQKRNLFS